MIVVRAVKPIRASCPALAGKAGEIEPLDLSGELVVQLGTVTEPLNRRWYEHNTGQIVADVQRRAVRRDRG